MVTLAEVVLVNENRDASQPGDVMVFPSIRDACAYLEPWWVEDGEGMALAANGDRIILGVAGAAVVEVSREPFENGVEIAMTWLRYLLLHKGAVPDAAASISDLLKGVQFDR